MQTHVSGSPTGMLPRVTNLWYRRDAPERERSQVPFHLHNRAERNICPWCPLVNLVPGVAGDTPRERDRQTEAIHHSCIHTSWGPLTGHKGRMNNGAATRTPKTFF